MLVLKFAMQLPQICGMISVMYDLEAQLKQSCQKDGAKISVQWNARLISS